MHTISCLSILQVLQQRLGHSRHLRLSLLVQIPTFTPHNPHHRLFQNLTVRLACRIPAPTSTVATVTLNQETAQIATAHPSERILHRHIPAKPFHHTLERPLHTTFHPVQPQTPLPPMPTQHEKERCTTTDPRIKPMIPKRETATLV